MPNRTPSALLPLPGELALMTDLYELTMMVGYLRTGLGDRQASFEIFVRRLPRDRAYLIFAGLEQVVAAILDLHFTADQIVWLGTLPAFRGVDPAVLEELGRTRFEGDVWAIPEGTVVFPGETLMRVSAPAHQAQWLETLLLATLSFQTLVASKASRLVAAAGGKPLFEFGARRGQGPAAGLMAARAAYLAGFVGTSLVEAGRQLGIPVVGTMAHSWVQAFESESQAFEAYARTFPGQTTLLVDTYNVAEAVRKAAAIDPPIEAIRIDSGDVQALARLARLILDQNNRTQVKIIASGDLNEHSIAHLIETSTPIDGFGVGSELIAPADAPALSLVYKLVQIDGRGAYKLSAGKRTYPMAKQVFRSRDAHGRFTGDLVTRSDETAPGQALLQPVIEKGKLVGDLPTLDAIRDYRQQQVEALPDRLRALDAQPDYPVAYSVQLEEDGRRLMRGD